MMGFLSSDRRERTPVCPARIILNRAPSAARTSALSVVVFFLHTGAPAFAGVDPDLTPHSRPAFKPFRYDEDWSVLRDPSLRTEPLDNLKFIPLSTSDPRQYLSIGGESRTRYDSFTNPGFGLRGLGHDDFVIQRLLLSADLHLDERFRVFAQTVSGFQFGPESDPSPQQDDAFDLQQGFAEVWLGDSRDHSLQIRAGRMEMGFGSYRLVTARDPTNARLNFDGVRATGALNGFVVDAFVTRPVEQKRGLFNDGENDAQTFWGVYATLPLTPSKALNADVYYLGLRREGARFNSGIGTDERHSVGSRLWGAIAGLDYDAEGVFQFGTFGHREIRAWTVASSVGYTWSDAPWKPRFGMKANVASGDTNANDGTLGTFYALFPRQGYFSELNLLAPSNFFDIHPSIQLKPLDTVTLSASVDPFWRYTTSDGVYGPGRVAIPAAASAGRFVGTTLDTQVEWAISGQLSLTGYFGHFFRGDAVRGAGGKDVDYAGMWLTFRF